MNDFTKVSERGVPTHQEPVTVLDANNNEVSMLCRYDKGTCCDGGWKWYKQDANGEYTEHYHEKVEFWKF